MRETGARGCLPDRRHHCRRGRDRASGSRGARALRRRHPGQAAASPHSRSLCLVLQHGRPLPRRHAHDARGAVAMGKNRAFRPFATRGRRMIGAILLTFGLFSALSVDAVDPGRLEVAEPSGRRRGGCTAADARGALREGAAARRSGAQADPAAIGRVAVQERAMSLLEGGKVPAVEGDDDETTLTRENGSCRSGPVRAGAAARRRPHRDRQRDDRRTSRRPPCRPTAKEQSQPRSDPAATGARRTHLERRPQLRAHDRRPGRPQRQQPDRLADRARRRRPAGRRFCSAWR